MGLDMYLRATRYVSGYRFSNNMERAVYDGLVELFGVREAVDPSTPSATIAFTVAYWRKANAIHRWFVDNVQHGEDDCRDAEVTRAQLDELRDLAQRTIDSLRVDEGMVHTGTVWDTSGKREEYRHGQVVVNTETASILLPTQGGFFFGSTDYDDDYIADLHDTVKQLDRALSLGDVWGFEYHSSW